jgi:hypothetical protein
MAPMPWVWPSMSSWRMASLRAVAASFVASKIGFADRTQSASGMERVRNPMGPLLARSSSTAGQDGRRPGDSYGATGTQGLSRLSDAHAYVACVGSHIGRQGR